MPSTSGSSRSPWSPSCCSCAASSSAAIDPNWLDGAIAALGMAALCCRLRVPRPRASVRGSFAWRGHQPRLPGRGPAAARDRRRQQRRRVRPQPRDARADRDRTGDQRRRRHLQLRRRRRRISATRPQRRRLAGVDPGVRDVDVGRRRVVRAGLRCEQLSGFVLPGFVTCSSLGILVAGSWYQLRPDRGRPRDGHAGARRLPPRLPAGAAPGARAAALERGALPAAVRAQPAADGRLRPRDAADRRRQRRDGRRATATRATSASSMTITDLAAARGRPACCSRSSRPIRTEHDRSRRERADYPRRHRAQGRHDHRRRGHQRQRRPRRARLPDRPLPRRHRAQPRGRRARRSRATRRSRRRT